MGLRELLRLKVPDADKFVFTAERKAFRLGELRMAWGDFLTSSESFLTSSRVCGIESHLTKSS